MYIFHFHCSVPLILAIMQYLFSISCWKFLVYSRLFNLEFWGVNIEFTLYEQKWTIDAILQHIGFIIQQRIHVS